MDMSVPNQIPSRLDTNKIRVLYVRCHSTCWIDGMPGIWTLQRITPSCFCFDEFLRSMPILHLPTRWFRHRRIFLIQGCLVTIGRLQICMRRNACRGRYLVCHQIRFLAHGTLIWSGLFLTHARPVLFETQFMIFVMTLWIARMRHSFSHLVVFGAQDTPGGHGHLQKGSTGTAWRTVTTWGRDGTRTAAAGAGGVCTDGLLEIGKCLVGQTIEGRRIVEDFDGDLIISLFHSVEI